MADLRIPSKRSPRKPAVEQFLGLYKEGTKPRHLRLPTGKYRGCHWHWHWHDLADVIDTSRFEGKCGNAVAGNQVTERPLDVRASSGLQMFDFHVSHLADRCQYFTKGFTNVR